MLRSLNNYLGYEIAASDGIVGSTHDFYFNDEEWTNQYVVVDTGSWVPGRKVLVSPTAVIGDSWQSQSLRLDMTQERIKSCPEYGKDKPVSRQEGEVETLRLSRFIYWIPQHGPAPAPLPVTPGTLPPPPPGKENDPNLRSFREVIGYKVHDKEDKTAGKLEDCIVELHSWAIRYLVIDQSSWLSSGKRALVCPQWTDRIYWNERWLTVDLTREALEQAPDFDPEQPVNREFETRYYDYYGRPRYWDQPDGAELTKALLGER